VVRRLVGEYGPAESTLTTALRIYRKIGEPLGEANALHMLGIVKRSVADYADAITVLQEALRGTGPSASGSVRATP